MLLTSPTPISQKRFTVSTTTRGLWVSELSDFGKFFDFHQKIYDDACDTGFAIQAGDEQVWFVESRRETRDGGLLWIDFQPVTESVRRVPSFRGVTVRLFND